MPSFASSSKSEAEELTRDPFGQRSAALPSTAGSGRLHCRRFRLVQETQILVASRRPVDIAPLDHQVDDLIHRGLIADGIRVWTIDIERLANDFGAKADVFRRDLAPTRRDWFRQTAPRAYTRRPCAARGRDFRR